MNPAFFASEIDKGFNLIGELKFDQLIQNYSDDGQIVSAYFFERGSRVPKEIVWAGDGIQVWLQLLYQVHRVRNADTIILDEPELHLCGDALVPDLVGWRRERMPELPDVAAFELAPDWVCEVLSPSTQSHDRVKKMGIYAREGVGHV